MSIFVFLQTWKASAKRPRGRHIAELGQKRIPKWLTWPSHPHWDLEKNKVGRLFHVFFQRDLLIFFTNVSFWRILGSHIPLPGRAWQNPPTATSCRCPRLDSKMDIEEANMISTYPKEVKNCLRRLVGFVQPKEVACASNAFYVFQLGGCFGRTNCLNLSILISIFRPSLRPWASAIAWLSCLHSSVPGIGKYSWHGRLSHVESWQKHISENYATEVLHCSEIHWK